MIITLKYESLYLIPDMVAIDLSNIKLPAYNLLQLGSDLFYSLIKVNSKINVPTFDNWLFTNYISKSVYNFISISNKTVLDFSIHWKFTPKLDVHLLSDCFFNAYCHHLLLIILGFYLYPYAARLVSRFFDIFIEPLYISSDKDLKDLNRVKNNLNYNINSSIPKLMVFSMLISPANSEKFWGNISLTHYYYVVFWLFILFYIFLGWGFDHLSYRIYGLKTINNNFFNYIMCGILYSLSILIGIFSTNSLWYLIYPKVTNLLASTLFTGLSVVFAAIWYTLRRDTAIYYYSCINSLFRSIIESLAFISICVSTYGIWNLYIEAFNDTNIAYLVGFSFGILVHFLSGFYLIRLEFFNGSMILYGILYWIWWTSCIINTNSVIGLFIDNLSYNEYWYYWMLTIFLSFLSTIFNFPCYYLNSITQNLENINLGYIPQESRYVTIIRILRQAYIRNRYIILLRLYLCILAYCMYGGLLWNIVIYNFI